MNRIIIDSLPIGRYLMGRVQEVCGYAQSMGVKSHTMREGFARTIIINTRTLSCFRPRPVQSLIATNLAKPWAYAIPTISENKDMVTSILRRDPFGFPTLHALFKDVPRNRKRKDIVKTITRQKHRTEFLRGNVIKKAINLNMLISVMSIRNLVEQRKDKLTLVLERRKRERPLLNVIENPLDVSPPISNAKNVTGVVRREALYVETDWPYIVQQN